MPQSGNFDVMANSPGGACWLDVRVIYVRISAPAVSYAEAPEKLSLRCGPRDVRSELEINGARIPPSEAATIVLRLDRTDEDSCEAIYVGTDKLRLSSCLPYVVFHDGEQLVAGLISCKESLPPWVAGVDSLDVRPLPAQEWQSDLSRHGAEPQKSSAAEWGMRCFCTVSPSWGGFTIKSLQDLTTGQPVQPSLEVCVVGKCCGTSIMLTDQVQLLARKRSQWKGGLDVIPEREEGGKPMGATVAEDTALREHQHKGRGDLQEIEQLDGQENSQWLQHPEQRHQQQQGHFLEGLWPTQTSLNGLYGDEENGEMSWFNAGVRVGVGIGLGMCIGVGIGVGLIVKTYQATTRPLRGARFL